MKITILSNLFPPTILGGAEIAAHSIGVELVKLGHMVEVITIADKDEEAEADGMRIHRLGSRPFYSPYWAKKKPGWMKPLWHLVDLYNPLMARRVGAILKRSKPDILHCHNIVGFSTAAWASAAALGIPVVLHLHDYHLVCPKATLMDESLNACGERHKACNLRATYHRRALDRNVRRVISPSRFCVETVYGRFPEGRSPVPYDVIPNGTVFSAIDRPRLDWRAPKLKVLFVGGLFRHKGAEFLIDLIERLLPEAHRLEFHIAGKGPLEERVTALAAKHAHVFYHGFIGGERKRSLFLSSHLFLFPSIWLENNPVSVLEALAVGMPVLGSDIGGVPEILAPVSEQLLFRPGSLDDAAARLIEFEENRDWLASVSEGLLAKRDQYGMERQAARILSVFRGLLA